MEGSKAARKGSNPNNTFDVIFIGASQKRTFTGTSAQSTAVSAGCTVVRLYTDQDCYIEVGTSPTATTSSMLLKAGFIEYFGIIGGQKIAALQSSTGGTLYITEGAST